MVKRNVKIKEPCSACPFTGKCSQCNGTGYFETIHSVDVDDESEDLRAALVEATAYIYTNVSDSDDFVAKMMAVIRGTL